MSAPLFEVPGSVLRRLADTEAELDAARAVLCEIRDLAEDGMIRATWTMSLDEIRAICARALSEEAL